MSFVGIIDIMLLMYRKNRPALLRWCGKKDTGSERQKESAHIFWEMCADVLMGDVGRALFVAVTNAPNEMKETVDGITDDAARIMEQQMFVIIHRAEEMPPFCFARLFAVSATGEVAALHNGFHQEVTFFGVWLAE